MVSCPLLTPLTFLWTRLPSVARLKARGPQMRLLLQGTTLIEAELFAAERCRPALSGRALTALRFTQSKFGAVMRPKSCPTHGTEPP